MAKRRRRKKKLRFKYKVRRVLLFLVFAGLAGGIGWRIVHSGGQPEPEQTVPAGIDVAAATRIQMPDFTAVLPQAPQEGAETPEDEAAAVDAEVQEEAPDLEPEPELYGAVYQEDTSGWSLVLVNDHYALPDSFEPQLEAIVDDVQVDARIATNLRKMFAHAKADGIELVLFSGYESGSSGESEEGEEERQTALTPASGEYGTGLAVNIVTTGYQRLREDFDQTHAFRWLEQHAADYGFVLRYPKDKEPITGMTYEPWHFRFVGEYHAAVMAEHGYCLEEYLLLEDDVDGEGPEEGEDEVLLTDELDENDV